MFPPQKQLNNVEHGTGMKIRPAQRVMRAQPNSQVLLSRKHETPRASQQQPPIEGPKSRIASAVTARDSRAALFALARGIGSEGRAGPAAGAD